MESSGTPAPAGQPPPPTTSAGSDKAGGGWRALALVLALALAFACAVMVIAMADIADTRTCEVVKEELRESLSTGGPRPADDECFDGSSGQKTATLVLGWPSALLAGVATLVALFFVGTGRSGRLLLQLTGAAIVLGAASILVGSI